MKKKNNQKYIGILIIIPIIALIILFDSYQKNLSHSENIDIRIYEQTMPHLKLPGITYRNISVKNKNDRDYKEVNISITCYSNEKFSGRGNLTIKNFASNSAYNGEIKITKFGDEPNYCEVTNYSTEDYNFFEWIEISIKKIIKSMN